MLLPVTAALALVGPAERPLCAEQACPTVSFSVRSNGALERVLTGGHASLYRLQPELFIGFRPAEGISLFAGGGAGPALVVRKGGRVGLTSSGALGARLTLGKALILATARVEAVLGRAAAVTLELRFTWGP